MARRATEATAPAATGTPGRLTLALALGSGAVAWGIHLVGSYALLAVACAAGTAWVLHAVTVVTLALAVAGAWYCLRMRRRREGQAAAHTRDRRAEARRFLGLSGALLNGLFAFAILLEGLPVAFIDPCLGLP